MPSVLGNPLTQTISDDEHVALFPTKRYSSQLLGDMSGGKSHGGRRQEAMDAARQLSAMFENSVTTVTCFEDGELCGTMHFRNNVQSIANGDCR